MTLPGVFSADCACGGAPSSLSPSLTAPSEKCDAAAAAGFCEVSDS